MKKAFAVIILLALVLSGCYSHNQADQTDTEAFQINSHPTLSTEVTEVTEGLDDQKTEDKLIPTETEATSGKDNSTETTEEEEEKKDEGLYSLSDGNINIKNEDIQELYERLFIDYNELYIFPSTDLYTKSITDFSNKDKLFLISKTKKFNDLIDKNNNIYSKEDLCNHNTYIDSTKVEEIAKENFNITNLNHTNFIMTFVKDDVFLSYMEFTFSDNGYIGKCIEYEIQPIEKVATSILSTASKEKDYIYLDIKVIFQTKDGIFKDANLTTKISDTFNSEYELNYYASGSLYRIYYKYNDNKDYFLEKIELMQ